MESTRKPNAMLIELVIVILFFSISAGIILQLFVAAHEKSTQSSVDTDALMMAEDFAEQFIASPLDAAPFMAAEGFMAEGEEHVKLVDREGRSLRLVVENAQSQTEAGALDELVLTIYERDRVAITLPVARYRPEVISP